MKKCFISSAVFLFLISIAGFSLAQEPAGKSLSKVCSACHGQEGVSNNTLWPSLAGQKKDYLLKQLRDFKLGERKNPLMTSLVQTLSEQDMEILSVYYSQLKAE